MVPTHRARGKFQLTGCWTLLRASLAGGANATAVPGHVSSRADDGGERYVPQNDSWLQRRSSSSVGRAAVAPARCRHSSICRHSTGRSRPNADERPRYAHAQQGRATTSMHVDAWRASAIAQDAEPNLIALVLCYVAGRWHRMRTAAADGLRLFRALPGTYRQPCDTYAGRSSLCAYIIVTWRQPLSVQAQKGSPCIAAFSAVRRYSPAVHRCQHYGSSGQIALARVVQSRYTPRN